jgi:hypothetical protein
MESQKRPPGRGAGNGKEKTGENILLMLKDIPNTSNDEENKVQEERLAGMQVDKKGALPCRRSRRPWRRSSERNKQTVLSCNLRRRRKAVVGWPRAESIGLLGWSSQN